MGIQLGLGIGFFLAAVVAVPLLLIRSSRKYHDEHHQRHSELTCEHCTARYYAPGVSASEAHRRWPRRITGERAPQGTG